LDAATNRVAVGLICEVLTPCGAAWEPKQHQSLPINPLQACGVTANDLGHQLNDSGLALCIEKMGRDGVAEEAIQSFTHYYQRLTAGETGLVMESEIDPLGDLPEASDLPIHASRDILDQFVVIKLNGGLATSMGMTKAKSLVAVAADQTFLDIIARQVLALRRRTGARLPLVLMNSFHTRSESLAALARHPGISSDVPLDFVQNKEPKLRADDLTPVDWPTDRSLEWCPPGHGDLYTALVSSGLLATLLQRSYRYAFVSNSDNLGATLDTRIAGWFGARRVPFLAEVCRRTEADRKGGHLARLRESGGLVLRESAQTHRVDVGAFQNVARHRYFNCNSLWLDLRVLAKVMADRKNVLGLPLIINRKTVDPGDPASVEVVQLETAMSAAVGVFEGAELVRVPRSRFAPVKTTSDLLVIRSDAYQLTCEADLRLTAERSGRPPLVSLDDQFFKLLPDFEARFSNGAPSLLGCDELRVRGDVTFGANVVCLGSVEIDGPARIPDGAILGG
jgi:UTP--glucose-1-phosphate uridylyltransferase